MNAQAPDSSHIGWLQEQGRILDQREFSKFEQLVRSSNPTAEALRAALNRLCVYLNHQLVAQISTKLPDEGKGRLTTFTRSPDDERSYFAVVTGKGRLAVGTTDLEYRSDLYTLEEFEPFHQEVVSLAVSRRHRFLGQRLDLWILVRSLISAKTGTASRDLASDAGVQREEILAYHGLISFPGEGQVEVRPAVDDWEDGVARWRADKVHGLPRALTRYQFACAPDADSCDPLVQEHLDRLQDPNADSTVEPERIARSCGYLATYVKEGIHLVPVAESEEPPTRHRLSNTLEETISFLTLQDGDNGSVHGVAGSDSQRLLGFTHHPEAPNEEDREVAWTQVLPDYPADAAFVSGPRAGWPDLLVLSRNGELQRLHFLGREAIYRVWTQLWERLCGKALEDRLRIAKEVIGEPIDRSTAQARWQQTALFGAVERVIWHLNRQEATPDQLQRWAEQLTELFQPTIRPRDLRPSLDIILRFLETRIQAREDPLPVEDGCDFGVALLERIYDKLPFLHTEALSQIDRVIRSLPAVLPTDWQCKTLSGLVESSRRNRSYIWHNEERQVFTGPDKELRTAIYRATFGLERWASAFLPTDSVRLRQAGETQLAPLADLVGWRTRSASSDRYWLAAARGDQLWISEIAAYTRLDLEQPHSLTLPDGARALHLQPVAGKAQGLLVLADSRGRLHLVRLDTQGRPERVAPSAQQPPSAHEGSTLWALCALPGSDPPLLLAGSRSGWRSALYLYRLHGTDLTPVAGGELPLALPAVNCLQVSRRPSGGWYVLTTTAHSGHVQLHTLRTADGYQLEAPAQEIELSKEGILTACFDAEEHPACVSVGDRGGVVWCLNLQPDASNPAGWLRWTYKLDSAIRSLGRVTAFGEACFLAGTERGRLVLLRARDGRRLWKHRMLSPVRLVRPIQGPEGVGLAIGMRDSWVSLFVQVTETRAKTWEQTEALLAQIQPAPPKRLEELWLELGAESVRVLLELRQNPSAFARLLQEPHLSRTDRARGLRYLAELWHPGAPEAQALQDALPWLTLRELGLTLHYLPDGASAETLHSVREELQRRVEHNQVSKGIDNGRQALMAAVVIALQRLPRDGTAREQPSLEQILSWAPSLELLEESTWVRVELARLLLTRLASKHPKAKDAALLAWALPSLLRLSPLLVSGCVLASPSYSSPHSALREAFQALARLLRELQEATPSHPEDWQCIAELLAEAEDPLPAAAVLQPLLELGGTYLEFVQRTPTPGAPDAESTPASWTEERAAFLDPLRQLSQTSRSLSITDLPGSLLPQLAGLLPENPLPGEDQSQDDRISWWRRLEEKLQAAPVVQAPADQAAERSRAPWEDIFQALATWLRSLLGDLQRWEVNYLLNEARPRLELRTPGLEADDLHRLHLLVRVVPESRRPLQGVTVALEAQLRGTVAERTANLKFPHFPAAPQECALRGYAETGQPAVRVLAELRGADGAYHRRTWTFPIRWPSASELDDSQKALTFVHDALSQRLQAETAPVRLVVLDRPLGRPAWGRAWVQANGWRRVDLDALLHDTGEGRKYAERQLGLEVIREAILTGRVTPRRQAEDLDASTNSPPILVGPMDQVLQRLLDGEAPGQMEALMAWLQRRQPDDGPPITLVVSALHAARLRAYGTLPTLAMHLLLHGDGTNHVLPRGEAFDAAVAWLGATAAVPAATAEVVLTELGGDLALAAAWRRWWSQRERSVAERAHPELPTFLRQPEVGERLRAEFAGLGYWERLYAVLSALATSTLRRTGIDPGLISAEEYRSTTKRGQPGKMLQTAGEPFTLRALQSLQSDQRPPDRLQAEGLGTRGTPKVAKQTTLLLPLALRAGSARRQHVAERLADLGLGTWQHGILRAAAPYRGWVRDLYRRYADSGDSERDGLVFQHLLRQDASPLEGLTPSDLLDLRDELQHLQRDASAGQRQALQRLAAAWTLPPDKAEEPLGQALRALFPNLPVEPLAAPAEAQHEPTRWDQPLRGLSSTAFGLGRHEGREGRPPTPRHYLLWLATGAKLDLSTLAKAIERSRKHRQELETRDPGQPAAPLPTEPEDSVTWHPSIALLGPGVDTWTPDPERRVAVLRFADLLHLAWHGRFSGEGLLGFVRSQLRLTAMSPFSTSGSLEPGSPLFRGREAELDFLYRHVRRSSVLIVGARRVGKTSLLNQVYGWAKQQDDLLPLFVDLQYKATPEAFQAALAEAVEQEQERPGSEALQGVAPGSVQAIVEAGRRAGRLPLFLFNEIDGLVGQDELVGQWRSLSDAKQAQFVLVAYTAVAQLGRPESPFFHFTQGPHLDGKAIVLTALSAPAAHSLLGLLTEEPLKLRWASEAVREQGEVLLVDRSYRIPWVLQRFAQLLVERMESERREQLTLADAQAVVAARGGVVWRYIQNLEWDQLGYQDSLDRESARRPGYQLLLYAVARQRYFLGAEPAIQDLRLAERSPLASNLGFTLDDATRILEETIQQLLFDAERQQVMRWLQTVHLPQALRLLTLTLALEPDPEQADRYGFLLHILPRELHRQYGDSDPTLDGLIAETAVKLIELMKLPLDRGALEMDGATQP